MDINKKVYSDENFSIYYIGSVFVLVWKKHTLEYAVPVITSELEKLHEAYGHGIGFVVIAKANSKLPGFDISRKLTKEINKRARIIKFSAAYVEGKCCRSAFIRLFLRIMTNAADFEHPYKYFTSKTKMCEWVLKQLKTFDPETCVVIDTLRDSFNAANT